MRSELPDPAVRSKRASTEASTGY
uniref:Uncharacterized protein n=1 Tax=Arundo donax TaxID=35708 RepID=A0A0A9A527_ARUDO